MLSLANAATLGFSSTPTSVDGVYGGAFLFPDTSMQSLLEIPFFLHFANNYGTLYMYGDKNAWCARAAPAPSTPTLPPPSRRPPAAHPTPSARLSLPTAPHLVGPFRNNPLTPPSPLPLPFLTAHARTSTLDPRAAV